MTKLVKASMISMAAVAVLSMTGCGSDDSSNDSNSTSGKAVDGYIDGARVCLDMNASGTCDAGEPSAQTDANGAYKLNLSNAQAKAAEKNARISLLVYGGTDIDSNETLVGTLKAPFDGNTTNITPLTTLVSAMIQNGEIKDKDEAYDRVATVLGINDPELLTKDPVAYAKDKNDSTILAKAMVLHNMVAALADANNTTDSIYKDIASYAANTQSTQINSVVDLVVGAAKEKNLTDKNVTALDTIYTIFRAQEYTISTYGDNLTAVKNVAKDIAKVVKASQENNTTILQEKQKTAKKTLINAIEKGDKTAIKIALNSNDTNLTETIKATVPNIIFGEIKFSNGTDGNTTDLNATNLTAYTFADMNITKDADSNLSDFNLTLADINVTKAFAKQTATLDIKVADESNASKNIELSIPGVVIDGNTTDFNITIPKDANATFTQKEVNITDNNTTNYIFGSKEVFSSTDNNLTISVDNLLTDMNVSDNTKTNLNNYFDKNRTYKLSIGFTGIDSTELIAPASINGLVDIKNR